jgi:hypothetical protein
MKLENFALLLLVLFAAAYVGWYFYDQQGNGFIATEQSSPQDTDRQVAAPDAGAGARERIPMPPQHPVSPPEQAVESAQPAEPTLPGSLAETDAYLQQRLPQLVAKPELLNLLTLQHFIQKLVVIIDQLPEKTIPRLHLPIVPPEPGFRTSGADDHHVGIDVFHHASRIALSTWAPTSADGAPRAYGTVWQSSAIRQRRCTVQRC